MVLVSVVILGGVGQAACGQGREAVPSSESSAIPPAEPAHAPITGSFTAISTTAMGITGDLTVTSTVLTFTRGLVYETQQAGTAGAKANYAGGAGTWADLLGVPPETVVELRRVTGESIGQQAPNGDLCARDTTTFIALAAADGMNDTPALKLAAFKGATPPGAQANAMDLCGTFNYERR